MNKEKELVELTFKTVKRTTKSGDVFKDIKEGYVYFQIQIEANKKLISIEKRVRLDKPERMLNKLVTKLKSIAEEKYKEQKYYVANKEPPIIETVFLNEREANDKLLLLFQEINQYIKTGNPSSLSTQLIEFNF